MHRTVISNRLGVDHECDGQTDRQIEWPLAIACGNTVFQKSVVPNFCNNINFTNC